MEEDLHQIKDPASLQRWIAGVMRPERSCTSCQDNVLLRPLQ